MNNQVKTIRPAIYVPSLNWQRFVTTCLLANPSSSFFHVNFLLLWYYHLTHGILESCKLLSFFQLHFTIWNKIVCINMCCMYAFMFTCLYVCLCFLWIPFLDAECTVFKSRKANDKTTSFFIVSIKPLPPSDGKSCQWEKANYVGHPNNSIREKVNLMRA